VNVYGVAGPLKLCFFFILSTVVFQLENFCRDEKKNHYKRIPEVGRESNHVDIQENLGA